MITFGILAIAAVFCFWIQDFSESDNHVPLIFVLAVVLVSRFTEGYAYGVLASMIAVVGVNYVFTYPYFELNFSLTGYPLTFVAMLAVAAVVSALTTQIKEKEQIRLEVEREKMRGNLLRAVSHDIRTPLTSIVGASSLLLENEKELSLEQKKEFVEDIRSEAQWLIRIVENLLSITRIGDGSDSAKIDKVEEMIEEIIGSAVLKLKKRFPEVEVNIVLPDELVLAPMDGILIEQVLVNLLENAVLHGKTTSRIEIRVEEDEEWVTVFVEDNGQGIRDGLIPQIFNGSMQSEEGRVSDSKRNMGIGLSVCKTIVKAHKGDMKAENIENSGARFTFWLPK
ncbi:MAG: PAS domain-containing sensor histidine kinase [Lachnoclostridium sp.]|nr:PAS domain-containing sensor histidine kinase [Lachnoclostridium sp.]